jgi:hypothetical protein
VKINTGVVDWLNSYLKNNPKCTLFKEERRAAEAFEKGESGVVIFNMTSVRYSLMNWKRREKKPVVA